MGFCWTIGRRAGPLLAVLVAAAVLSPLPASALSDGALVTVQTGTVRGKIETGGRTFFAIPYAAPPTGERRFRPPQPAAEWTGVRDATRKGDICPQSVPLGSVSEDCLQLNVYTPPAAESKDLPVMVWFHGGAYVLGTGAGEDPAPLVAKGDVIVVSMNYRLGPFGFMALPGLAEESKTTGNYALLDQQAALRWVRDNITAFGGDPGNVTIFGESAGGHSVCMQLISPTAAGLFHKAISQSGGCVDTALGPRAANAAYETSQDFATSLGCADPDPDTVVACLRGKSVDDLLSTAGNPLGTDGPGWTPVIDTSVIKEPTEAALRAGRYHKVPIVNGTTKDEGRLFTALLIHLSKLRRANADDLRTEIEFRAGDVSRELLNAYPPASSDNADLAISQVTTDGAFSCPALFTAQAAVSNAGQKVFAYELADPGPPLSGLDPLMPLGDYHGSELPYLFDTLEGIPVRLLLNDDQKKLSNQMLTYWTSFAATGDPNSSGTPAWPTFTSHSPQTQRLTSRGTAPIATFADDHKCHLWN
ncbi:carboxylesterase/lipase family protein [Actinomadura sp. 3N407]|uniref:carboxylesterase/lipase family protein n=1 Tax=Actinomadura sp. 3N407 TaxID=3457423 RepID=UPI003FCD5BCF